MALVGRIAEVLGVVVALVWLLRPVVQWLRTRKRVPLTRLRATVLLLGGLASTSHAAITFDDDFEYVANRADNNVQVPFEAAGWTDLRANNTNGGDTTGGYLYTVDDATLGSKVLVMESLPTTVGGQADYWLKLLGSAGYIPANVWFQFWTYATVGSEFNRQKFLYPCHQDYPCPNSPPADNAHNWLVSFNATNGVDGVGGGVVTAPSGGRYFRISGGTPNHTAAGPSDTQKLYQNLAATPMLEGTWYLVKIHFDTSGAQGTYELWMRQHGVATFTKEAEWIGGVTANFDWPIDAARRNGNMVLSMPTTVDTYDSTTYMDDFVMATTEGDLPVYSDGSNRLAFFLGSFAPYLDILAGGLAVAHLLASLRVRQMARRGYGVACAAVLAWRTRRAVARWQRQAPLMLDAPSELVELSVERKERVT